ncbi:hypothetical protein CsSME_00023412 [Camellia sinensis var. sinensis]
MRRNLGLVIWIFLFVGHGASLVLAKCHMCKKGCTLLLDSLLM